MRLTPKRAVWIGLALAAALWGVWGRPGSPGTASVLYVVDGDTLKVRAGEGPEGVRLIGIDAPESRDNPKAKRDVKRTRQGLREILALGQRSKQFVQELVRPGDRVRLEFDAERRDRYGRLLAYVYLPDGRMLNELIIASGYAYPLTIPPNVRYQARFLEAFRRAREQRAGLWQE